MTSLSDGLRLPNCIIIPRLYGNKAKVIKRSLKYSMRNHFCSQLSRSNFHCKFSFQPKSTENSANTLKYVFNQNLSGFASFLSLQNFMQIDKTTFKVNHFCSIKRNQKNFAKKFWAQNINLSFFCMKLLLLKDAENTFLCGKIWKRKIY